METKIKCFSEEHKEIDAISFCQECRLYMCNKCDNIHSSFLKKHHNTFSISELEEIFTGFCKEKNHHPNKLKYFCLNHNKLCCGLCIAKLNKEGDGQHKDCNVCYIENIKEEKKNKLLENIKYLEEIENKFNENMKELKSLFTQIEKDKEGLKLKVQQIFTKIRNTLNDREDKLLLDIDNLYNSKYLDENIIKKGEKLPNQIKLFLEKGRIISKELNNNSDNNLCSYINDCVDIENNIKYIDIIIEKVKQFNKKDNSIIEFMPKGESFNKFLISLNSFGEIQCNSLDSLFRFRECPKEIDSHRSYILKGKNKNILVKTGKGGSYMGTICENELYKSVEVHRWKIKILKSLEKNIMVGVAPSDFDICSSNYRCGWYLFCYYSPPKLFSGQPFSYNGLITNLSKVNDEIKVEINMKKRAIKFIINDEDKGYSYENIPIDKPLYPAILLLDTNDSIEISGY